MYVDQCQSQVAVVPRTAWRRAANRQGKEIDKEGGVMQPLGSPGRRARRALEDAEVKGGTDMEKMYEE
jgi:hypothetical protein